MDSRLALFPLVCQHLGHSSYSIPPCSLTVCSKCCRWPGLPTALIWLQITTLSRETIHQQQTRRHPSCHTCSRVRTYTGCYRSSHIKVQNRARLCTLMPNHLSFYYTHLVCNPCPFPRNYSRQVAGGRHAVIVFEGGMAVAKIDFGCHICTEEFEHFPPSALYPKRTLSFSELAAPGVVCFLLFFQLESIDLTEWRAISDISPSLRACGVICWRFSAMLYVDLRPAPRTLSEA